MDSSSNPTSDPTAADDGASVNPTQASTSGSSGDSGADEASGGNDIFVGEPSNIAGADDSSCHDVDEELPDTFVLASCVGPELQAVDDPMTWCSEGPKPFGSWSVVEKSSGFDEAHACPLETGGETHEIVRSSPYYLAVASKSGAQEVQVDVLSVASGASSHAYRCEPAVGEPETFIGGATPFPVGDVTCGVMTVVYAEPDEAPIVRVNDEGESAVYLQMVEL